MFRIITGNSCNSLKNSCSSKIQLNQCNVVFSRNVMTKRRNFEIPKRSTDGRKKITPFGWFLLMAPATAFGLGTWQVQRKKWKENLLQEMESKLFKPSVPLPDNLSDLESMEYQTVSAKGYFLHDKEIYLGPRALMKPDDKDMGGGLMSVKNSSSGYIVITPFKLENRDETILVNRGWVSRSQLKPETREKGQIKGVIELNGVVRNPEPRPNFTPANKNDVLLYRDVPRMCALTGADPCYIDAKVDSTVAGGPIGGQTRVTLRNEHMSYIVTWYSLSAFTAFLWFKQIVRRAPF